jgi:hypothetical protein
VSDKEVTSHVTAAQRHAEAAAGALQEAAAAGDAATFSAALLAAQRLPHLKREVAAAQHMFEGRKVAALAAAHAAVKERPMQVVGVVRMSKCTMYIGYRLWGNARQERARTEDPYSRCRVGIATVHQSISRFV